MRLAVIKITTPANVVYYRLDRPSSSADAVLRNTAGYGADKDNPRVRSGRAASMAAERLSQR